MTGRALPGRVRSGRRDQQVKVPRSEQALVQVTQLDHHFLVEAQRPTFMTEEQPAIRRAGILLEVLEKLLGRQQEVDEVSEAVSSVAALHHTEDLAEDCGGRGLEGRVQRGQGCLDAPVQGLRVHVVCSVSILPYSTLRPFSQLFPVFLSL